MNKRGRLFIVSAPSGTGKSTVVNQLLKKYPELVYSISYTTRPPRPEEKDGREYKFINKDEFTKLAGGGFFAEYANVHGALYGTPKKPIDEAISKGQLIVLDIDVQGGMALKKLYPDAVTIFLVPPSFEELEARLAGRQTDSKKDIEKRLSNAKIEMGYKDKYDYQVINDKVDNACAELADIISSKKA